jgi:hypothetical protein
MELTSVTYNGTTVQAAQTGTFTWAAADFAIRLRPDLRWSATRNDRTASGETAQDAVDAIAAIERKAAREDAARASLTKGQLFARLMRQHLSIGPRTRRHRINRSYHGSDLHTAIVRTGIEAVTEGAEYGHREDFITACRAAFGALLSYDKHIADSRAATIVVAYVNALSPWDLCALLADMADADVIHVGAGERWFSQLADSLVWDPQGHPVRRELQAA